MVARILRVLAPVALLAAAACNDTAPVVPGPLDRFYFPSSLAIRHQLTGCDPSAGSCTCLQGSPSCQTQLWVVSTNFDLRYDSNEGGSVIGVDVDAALAAGGSGPAPLPLQAPWLLGAVRIGSFGGELAVLDPPAPPTVSPSPDPACSTWTGGSQLLVTSRARRSLYRLTLGPDGALACGADCELLLTDSRLADPYGLALVCGTFPNASNVLQAQSLAFVSYLRTENAEGWLSQLDLTGAVAPAALDLGLATTNGSVFDPGSTRLYTTSRYAGVGLAPLRWRTLATPGAGIQTINVYDLVKGAELRGFALASTTSPTAPATRGYLAIRLFDADAASSSGVRPAGDVGGALAIIDLELGPDGQPVRRILKLVQLDRAPTEVRTIARPGRPDLVAVTSTDDGSLTLYDDEVGAIAKVFGLCGDATPVLGVGSVPSPYCSEAGSTGKPMLGKEPFGMAVEQLPATGLVRLFVGSFDRGWVNVITIDPANPRGGALSWARLGQEAP